MYDHVVEEIEHDGLTVKLYHDDEPSSPREWDNLGKMFCWHRSYDLGDEHGIPSDYVHNMAPDEFLEWVREEWGASVILPLFLYDHSELSMSTGSFADRWDSGEVGFICDTTETRKLMGFELDRFGRDEDLRERITEVLKGEVATYDQYLRGDVYGYVVEDGDGHHLDSCWGFYGTEDALSEGKAQAEWHAREIAKRKAQENARAIARTATLAWNGEAIEPRGTA